MKIKNYLLLTAWMAGPAFASIHINEIMVRNSSFHYNEDYNFVGWAELYNSGNDTVDVNNYFFSDSESDIYKWQNRANNIQIPPKGFAIFYFDEEDKTNHANFKLDSEGGTLILSDASGHLVDKVSYPKPFRNASYGRVQDGGDKLAHFVTPTIKATNNNAGTADAQTAAPEFSISGGFYSSSQTVRIYAEDGSAKIYYTTDGKEPTVNSMQYSSPIQINTTTPLRAIAVVNGEVASDITTATYFIGINNIPTSIKVVSLVTDRDYVYGDELGALVVGRNGKTVPSNCGAMDRTANYMNEWDRPCNFELYDENKETMANQEVKISAFGACSRTKAIKSMAVKASKAVGNNKFDCAIFREKPALKWKGLVLRNSGNDFGRMLFRDGYIQTVAASGMDLDHQAYEPTVVFMNGEYYAMLGMRERTNKDFVYSNHGLKEDEFCIEVTSKTGNSTCDDFQQVKNIASNANSADAFNKIDEIIDVDEFLNYMMTEIYIFNKDWSDNNNKAWKRNENGKWRWILYDTEYSTSLYEENMTGNGFEENVSRKLSYLSQLIKNPEMSRRLMTKFVAHAGTTFGAENTAYILDSMMTILNKEADYFRNFLAQKNIKETSLTWRDESMKVRNFLVARQNVVFDHVSSALNYGSPVPLRIYSDIPGSAYLLNGLELINKSDFRSKYFSGTQISVKAVAPVGYKFKKWEVCRENYIINTNDSWKYLYLSDSVSTPYNWKESSFDDSSWESGEAPLGGSMSYYVKTNVTGSSGGGTWPGGMGDWTGGMGDWTGGNTGGNNGNWNGGNNGDNTGGNTGGNNGNWNGGNWNGGNNGDNTGGNNGNWNGGNWNGGNMGIQPAPGDGIGGIGGIGGGDWGGIGGFGTSQAAKTIFLRKEFNIDNLNSMDNEIQCLAHIGDGAIIYLNGKEIYRYNLPNNVSDTTRAIYEMDSYATVSFKIRRSDLTQGKNVIAVELHSAKNSASVAFDLSMLDEKTGVTSNSSSNNEEYTGNVNEACVLRAVFEKDGTSTSYGKLYINEVCAANKQYVDEFRQDEDWIEIYNDGDVPVDLGGMYLSDKRKTLDRFQIPTNSPAKTTIPAKGYLVFWADADSSDQGPLHTNFELAKDKSQTISLSRKVNGKIEVIDSIRYQPHTDGETYSRFSYTGDGSWAVTSRPTFAKKNAYSPLLTTSPSEVTLINSEEDSALPILSIYPNPTSDYLWFSIDGEEADIVLADLTGRILLSKNIKNGSSIYVGNLENNVYVVTISVNGTTYQTKFVKL